jgi:hypothetical protein
MCPVNAANESVKDAKFSSSAELALPMYDGLTWVTRAVRASIADRARVREAGGGSSTPTAMCVGSSRANSSNAAAIASTVVRISGETIARISPGAFSRAAMIKRSTSR